MTVHPDTNIPPAVERYFAANPGILAEELTDENTLPRRPR